MEERKKIVDVLAISREEYAELKATEHEYKILYKIAIDAVTSCDPNEAYNALNTFMVNYHPTLTRVQIERGVS